MWVDVLLGKKKDLEAGEGTGKPRPAAPIHYNPKLISELTDEHQAALGLLARIRLAHAGGDTAGLAELLERFGSLLTAHLFKEDFRLYAYLEHSLTGDPATHTLVRQFREEMDGVGKAALAFLSKYRNIAVLPALPDNFDADAGELESRLRERIGREERTLYPMYLPAY